MLTPVEFVDKIYLKREDLFTIAGVNGGKARACYALAQNANGLITAGSKASPQVVLVSAIAKHLGIPCRVHVPSGAYTLELDVAEKNGAEVFQHKPGYNSVIIKRARDDAAGQQTFTYIPFGMECQEAVDLTAEQVQNMPLDVGRIVVPVGSGMTLSGILQGLKKYFDFPVKVIGVVVGADPVKRLNAYAPANWRDMVELVKSPFDYHHRLNGTKIGNVTLDPIYEAKAFFYLKPYDMLWIVGNRNL